MGNIVFRADLCQPLEFMGVGGGDLVAFFKERQLQEVLLLRIFLI